MCQGQMVDEAMAGRHFLLCEAGTALPQPRGVGDVRPSCRARPRPASGHFCSFTLISFKT